MVASLAPIILTLSAEACSGVSLAQTGFGGLLLYAGGDL